MDENLKRAWDLVAGVWLLVPDRMNDLIDRIARAPGNAADSNYNESPARIGDLLSQSERSRAAARNMSAATAGGTTAIIPVFGVLAKRGNWLTESYGLCSYDGIRAAVATAVADPAITRILMWFDSPGGGAAGTMECGLSIAAAAKRKETIAYVDSAGSAAYWLASQCSSITLTPSGEVGSVGVFCLHGDSSRALDAAGITPTFIVSKVSPHKVETNPFEPLAPDAKAHVQSEVDAIASSFVSAVAKGRRVSVAKVKSDFGAGRMLNSSDALRAGMVDRVATFDQVLRGASVDHAAARRSAQLQALSVDTSTHAIESRGRRLALLRQS